MLARAIGRIIAVGADVTRRITDSEPLINCHAGDFEIPEALPRREHDRPREADMPGPGECGWRGFDVIWLCAANHGCRDGQRDERSSCSSLVSAGTWRVGPEGNPKHNVISMAATAQHPAGCLIITMASQPRSGVNAFHSQFPPGGDPVCRPCPTGCLALGLSVDLHLDNRMIWIWMIRTCTAASDGYNDAYHGRLAQMAMRQHDTLEVTGSSPVTPTGS